MNNEPEYDKIHLAVMAIDKASRKMNISKTELYDRLNKQNLIHDRLIGMYDVLHTQSLDFVADDIIETLNNYETERVL
ncbi:MAG: DUF3791 domain-containing protein [Bacteroidales bacterium]|jgi:hypothetical protein|nr:DUF3791 domain-containing protein [Bacteroidales bacterium]